MLRRFLNLPCDLIVFAIKLALKIGDISRERSLQVIDNSTILLVPLLDNAYHIWKSFICCIQFVPKKLELDIYLYFSLGSGIEINTKLLQWTFFPVFIKCNMSKVIIYQIFFPSMIGLNAPRDRIPLNNGISSNISQVLLRSFQTSC